MQEVFGAACKKDLVDAPTIVCQHAGMEYEFGPELSAVRAKKQLTTGQLAEQSGVSAEAIRTIESGRSSPTLRTVGKLLAALGATLRIRWSR